MKWQPIETAPKDGTEVLLGWDIASVWLVRNGYWSNGWFDMNFEEGDIGWWFYLNSVTQLKLEGHNEPTHWMPLPEPPE